MKLFNFRKPKEIKIAYDVKYPFPCQFKDSFTGEKLSSNCKLKHLKEGK